MSYELTDSGDRKINHGADCTLPSTAIEQWQGISTLNKPDAGMVTAQRTIDQYFGSVQIFEAPARQALQAPPPPSNKLFDGIYDSPVKLNVQITNVPEVSAAVDPSEWIQHVDAAFSAGARAVEPVKQWIAKPNAINDALTAIPPALGEAINYYANTSPEEITTDAQCALNAVGSAVGNIQNTLERPLTPTERANAAGCTMPLFFFEGNLKEPLHAEAVQQLGLETLSESELSALGMRRLAADITDLHMPEVPEHLKHLELQHATPELIDAMRGKGREFVFARHGSEDYRYLLAQKVEAATGGDMMHILVKENPSKISVMEEFLHGTQSKIGLIDRLGEEIAEVRVKDFMLRHPRLLGLTENELRVLESLRDKSEDYAFRRGFAPDLFRVGRHE